MSKEPGIVIELSEGNFEATVFSGGIVLVDCWAAWCGPCRMFEPIFTAAAAKHPEHTFAKLDTEAHDDLVSSLDIEHIPTLLLYRDGILLVRRPGTVTAGDLENFIAQAESLDMDAVRAEIEADRRAADAGDGPVDSP